MRLRQVALVAHELDPVVEDLCAVLGTAVVFRDPDVGLFGLRNAVMPLGDTFLEVVSPVKPDTTAGRFLERRGGDGGYMVMVQTDDLAADRRRLTTCGVRIVFEVTLDDIAEVHLHPRDVGGAILSLSAPCPASSWRWAGPDWQGPTSDAAITEVEIEAADPARVAARWGQVLGRDAVPAGDAAREIRLEPGTVRFVPDRHGRGEGMVGLGVRLPDPARALAAARARALPVQGGEVVIGGTRIGVR